MVDAPSIRVGFVGLGRQGSPIAERIIAGGYPTRLWARRPETLVRFADRAGVAATRTELGESSDLVGVCVVADDDVNDVVLGDDGVLAGMAPGAVLAVHSTVRPSTCRHLADVAQAHGVHVVDAPVSGGAAAAAAGRLLVIVGGDDSVVDRCRPVLATFGDPIVHVGPVGSGQLAKLVNNALMAANLALVVDALAVGVAFGIDAGKLGEVLRHGSGRSYAGDVVTRTTSLEVLARGAGALLEKDVTLVVEAARDAGADLGELGRAAERGVDLLRRTGA